MKPKIITICGSTRFADLQETMSWEFEKLGYIVLRVHYLPEWYTQKMNWKENAHGAEQEGFKKQFDDLHCRKIDLSDIVFCCNAQNYIGESTNNELEYARSLNKPIYFTYGYAEDEGKALQEIARKLTGWWSTEGIG